MVRPLSFIWLFAIHTTPYRTLILFVSRYFRLALHSAFGTAKRTRCRKWRMKKPLDFRAALFAWNANFFSLHAYTLNAAAYASSAVCVAESMQIFNPFDATGNASVSLLCVTRNVP